MLFAFARQQHSCDEKTFTHVDSQATVVNKKDSEISDKHETISLPIATQEITVGVSIRSTFKSFSVTKLSQLSYFKALFSKRWLTNESNKDKRIQIFPSNDLKNNMCNAFNCNYNQIQFQFNVSHLTLLLKCFEISKIPETLCLELNELESLLYCHDYFNPQSNNSNESNQDQNIVNNEAFIMDQETLVTYFRNRIPALKKKAREDYFMNSTHPSIRKALFQLSKEYDLESLQNTNKNSRNNNINTNSSAYSYDYIDSLLKKIDLDVQTATRLFESQFNLVSCLRASLSPDTIYDGDDSESMLLFLKNVSNHYYLEIGIKDFDNTLPSDYNIAINNDENESDDRRSSILCKLWKLCSDGIQHLTAKTFEKIDCLIEKLLDPKTINCDIHALITIKAHQDDQIMLINDILCELMNQMVNQKLLIDDRRLQGTKYINISCLIRAYLIICARYVGIITFTQANWPYDSAQFMGKHDNEALVKCMCQITDKYFPRSITSDTNLKDLELSRDSIDNWILVLQNGLLASSKIFVMRHVELWFPILHEKRRKWLNVAVKELKTCDKYKSTDDKDNHGGNKESGDHNDYFNDIMIEKITKLQSNYEEKMAQWIIEHLILTTDQCFDFGLYLSKYIVFGKKDEKYDAHASEIQIPQVYIDFMNDHCGINWKLH